MAETTGLRTEERLIGLAIGGAMTYSSNNPEILEDF